MTANKAFKRTLTRRWQNRPKTYLTDALDTLKKEGSQDINDPGEKYRLKSMPGKFSGRHLLAITYTTFQQIDPSKKTGMDFAAKRTAAVQIQSASTQKY